MITQIKTFNGASEEKINEWLSINKIKIIDIKTRDAIEYHYNGDFSYQFVETIIIYEKDND